MRIDDIKRMPRIGIYGAGKSNRALLSLLSKRGVKHEFTYRSDDCTKVTDIKPSRSFIGKSALCDIDEDILFLSPSVRRDRPELLAASKRGVILSSDCEIFFDESKQRKFAVSGSDGKSSCTYLIASMLTAASMRAIPCGNFGVPLLSVIDEDAIAVAELSSFQLMNIAPTTEAALLTNITPNHLNWHKNLDEYISAKLSIFKNAKRRIIDADCPYLKEAASGMDIFACVSTKMNFRELKNHIKSEHYLTVNNDKILLDSKQYFTFKSAKRKEWYNIKNYALASAAVIDEVAGGYIERAIESFSGLAHRCEEVMRVGSVSYINSSIDSTPARTLATLKSLTDRRISVIICGKGKGLSAKELASALPSLTVGAVLMGEVGHEIYEYLSSASPSYKFAIAKDMTDAVSLAEDMIGKDGCVLLSPAATSFDAYKNFEERGDDFKRIVRLKNTR